VIPLYNEEATLPLLLAGLHALLAELPCDGEVVFVNDGSRDATGSLLAKAAGEDERLKVIELSRNFGQQHALTAGLDFATGDAVVIMDADLQDPPEVIHAMLARYEQGYDVVYAQRTRRDGESWLKQATARLFYWLMRRFVQPELPDNTGDFRLMSRATVDAFRQMREQHRFVRGMVSWLGFRQGVVLFERPPRVAGVTKYPLRKMLALAWRAIASSSGLPLRLSLVLGLLMVLTAVLGAGASVLYGLLAVNPSLGWQLLAALQVGLCGLTLFMFGVTGDYLARMYDEIKQRPLYIVRELINLNGPAPLNEFKGRAPGSHAPPVEGRTDLSRSHGDPGRGQTGTLTALPHPAADDSPAGAGSALPVL
jgi:dolichol-phosphate mannosyltransferase